MGLEDWIGVVGVYAAFLWFVLCVWFELLKRAAVKVVR